MLSDGKTLVDWTTSSETNNRFFTVEKSKDGKSFEEVGKVGGAGNSSANHDYHLIDEQPYAGISYYHLRQTDFNGHFSYSELVSVYNIDKNFSWYIFPNPAKDYITLAKTGDDMPNVLFQLFSTEGSLLQSIQLNTKSQHVFTIDIKDYSNGIYIGKIFDDYHQQVFKIVKN